MITFMTERYNRFSNYLRQKFGCRVYRVPLDAGFSCPTRDGSISTLGCLYCCPRGSASLLCDRGASVREQLLRGTEAMRRRYGAKKFIAYFQAFSNTYAPLEKLEQVYREGTEHPDVVGLAIGTRPDCVPESVLDLVAPYRERYETWIEYGLQSAHDATLAAINRGHTVAQFADAVRRTQRRAIKVCVHVILGLPGENREMMLETARFIASLPIEGIKIHLFHVLRGSQLEKVHREGGIRLLSKDDYVSIVCDFLELLPPTVVIQRLTGEAPRESLLAPDWALEKHAVLKAIGEELERRDSWQGSKRS